MDATGIEVLRGFTEDDVYVTQLQPSTNQHSHRLFLAKLRQKSLYDHIHNVTGHTGERVMKWHRENSLNGKYTVAHIPDSVYRIRIPEPDKEYRISDTG